MFKNVIFASVMICQGYCPYISASANVSGNFFVRGYNNIKITKNVAFIRFSLFKKQRNLKNLLSSYKK